MPSDIQASAFRPHSWSFRILGWAGVAAIAAAALFSGLQGDFLACVQLALFAAASIVVLEADWGLPRVFDFIFVAVSVGNAAGWVWDLYTRVSYYDEAAHFLTTFAFALSYGYLAYRALREHFRSHLGHFVFAITTFGVTLGVTWEVAEWLFSQSLYDPVSDLIADGLGALLAGVVAAWWLGSRPAGPQSRPPKW